MKFLLTIRLLLAAATLVVCSCDQRSPSEQVQAYTEETEKIIASQVGGPLTGDPIENTSPAGSTMDPTSNAYIVFDGSGSMMGKPLAQAKRAAIAFVQNAPEDLNIGLAVFDSERRSGKEIVGLGKGAEQREAVIASIDQVDAGGGTPLGAAIRIGTKSLIQQFQKQLRYGDIRLIVVTDGAASDAQEFRSAIGYANAYHVPIYTIGFRIQDSHPLRQFSEAYFTANDEKELLNAMEETLAELDDSVSLDL